MRRYSLRLHDRQRSQLLHRAGIAWREREHLVHGVRRRNILLQRSQRLATTEVRLGVRRMQRARALRVAQRLRRLAWHLEPCCSAVGIEDGTVVILHPEVDRGRIRLDGGLVRAALHRVVALLL